jgi:hypothetical protein
MPREGELRVDCEKLRRLLLVDAKLTRAGLEKRLDQDGTPLSHSVLHRMLGGSTRSPSPYVNVHIGNVQAVLSLARKVLRLSEAELPLSAVLWSDDDVERVSPGLMPQVHTDQLQSLSIVTPLQAGMFLASISISLASKQNYFNDFAELLAYPASKRIHFEMSSGIEDLLNHLLASVPEYYLEEARSDIFQAINQRNAVVYFGSIHHAKSEQIAKLPTLLKGFSQLSERQFRVGLFRLSATLVVLTVSTGGTALTAWKVVGKLQEIASWCVEELTVKPPPPKPKGAAESPGGGADSAHKS